MPKAAALSINRKKSTIAVEPFHVLRLVLAHTAALRSESERMEADVPERPDAAASINRKKRTIAAGPFHVLRLVLAHTAALRSEPERTEAPREFHCERAVYPYF